MDGESGELKIRNSVMVDQSRKAEPPALLGLQTINFCRLLLTAAFCCRRRCSRSTEIYAACGDCELGS